MQCLPWLALRQPEKQWGGWYGILANTDLAGGMKRGCASEKITRGIRYMATERMSYIMDPAHLILKSMRDSNHGYKEVRGLSVFIRGHADVWWTRCWQPKPWE